VIVLTLTLVPTTGGALLIGGAVLCWQLCPNLSDALMVEIRSMGQYAATRWNSLPIIRDHPFLHSDQVLRLAVLYNHAKKVFLIVTILTTISQHSVASVVGVARGLTDWYRQPSNLYPDAARAWRNVEYFGNTLFGGAGLFPEVIGAVVSILKMAPFACRGCLKRTTTEHTRCSLLRST